LVLEQGRSGQSVTAFCRDRGLRDSQLFAWKKRRREVEAAKFLKVELSPDESTRPEPVRNKAIEIRLINGRSLMIEPGFEASHLRALLAVLESDARSNCRVCKPSIGLMERESGWRRRQPTCAAGSTGWRNAQEQ